MNPILKTALCDVIDAVVAQIKANEGLLLNQAASVNANVATVIETELVNLIPNTGVVALIRPAILAALKADQPQIVAQLGGEEKVLIGLLETQLEAFKANLK